MLMATRCFQKYEIVSGCGQKNVQQNWIYAELLHVPDYYITFVPKMQMVFLHKD